MRCYSQGAVTFTPPLHEEPPYYTRTGHLVGRGVRFTRDAVFLSLFPLPPALGSEEREVKDKLWCQIYLFLEDGVKV